MVGDVITSVTIGGKQNPVQTETDYVTLVSPLPEGSKLSFIVRRGARKVVIPGVVLEAAGKGGK